MKHSEHSDLDFLDSYIFITITNVPPKTLIWTDLRMALSCPQKCALRCLCGIPRVHGLHGSTGNRHQLLSTAQQSQSLCSSDRKTNFSDFGKQFSHQLESLAQLPSAFCPITPGGFTEKRLCSSTDPGTCLSVKCKL